MELNREQIIKALEWCSSGGDCGKCTEDEANPHLSCEWCMAVQMRKALSLIKELTQANEQLSESYDHLEKTKDELLAERSRLTEENERLRDVVAKYEDILDKEHEHHQEMIGDLNEILRQIRYIKADTIQKMQEMVKANSFKHKNLGELVYFEDIDRIAKEMLEEK